jgi:hypothetical protein
MPTLPVIPPILDEARVASVTASPSAPVSTINVPFPVFGSQEDLTVIVAGVVLADSAWTFTSASGTSLNLLPLPITDGVVTLNTPVTSGVVQVIGSWQPRQVSVPSAQGITRREYEQAISTLIACCRELVTAVATETGRAEAAEAALNTAITLGVVNGNGFPTVAPTLGSGAIWNNGGFLCVG